MAYANREKIQSRSTKYLTPESVDADQLRNGQEFADSRIDSRLDAKYVVPFSDPAPDEIIEISADLAAYFIILDLFQNGTADAPVEYAQELYRRAMESLNALAGTTDATLPDPGSGDEILPTSIRVSPGRTGVLANFDGVNPPCYPRGCAWPY